MAQYIPSWLRDTLRVWAQYLALGIASIPAGVIYVLAIKNGVRPIPALLVASVIGCVFAYFLWRVLVNHSSVKRPTEPTLALAKPSPVSFVPLQAQATLGIVVGN